MKAEDLMIGDWVSFRSAFLDRVDGIAIGGHSVHLEHDRWQPVSDLKPIPITPEILKKNGFSLDEFGEWYEREVLVKERNHWVNVAFRNDGVAVYDLDILTGGKSSICVHKNYVHELQHALRLCGIDKEIVL